MSATRVITVSVIGSVVRRGRSRWEPIDQKSSQSARLICASSPSLLHARMHGRQNPTLHSALTSVQPAMTRAAKLLYASGLIIIGMVQFDVLSAAALFA
jgi:hypothetical protein